jgi:CheY-like chemotaxis protein
MKTNVDRYLLVVGSNERPPGGCLDAVSAGEDFAYDEAPTAAEAIALARLRRPALIVLNLQGHEEAGITACRELVAAESTRDVPILAIAGAPRGGQFMIALSVVPCDTDKLDREIHRIMDRVH